MRRCAIALACLFAAAASAALGPGSIVFTGCSSVNPDDAAFVCLTNVPGSQVVFLRDDEWKGAAWDGSGEGTLQWTAPVGGVSAGTVVVLSNLQSNAVRSASIGTLGEANSGFGFSGGGGSGDAIWAYTASAFNTSPFQFLCAIANNAAQFNGTNGTVAGTGLTVDQDAIMIGNNDAAQYVGTRSGKAQSWRDYVLFVGNDADNWAKDNDATKIKPFNTGRFALADAGTAVLLQESYETDGRGTRYQSPNDFADGNDFFRRDANNGFGADLALQPTDVHGYYFYAGDNLDVGGTNVCTNVLNTARVSGYANLKVKIALAAFASNVYENTDFISIDTRFDGGAWQTCGSFFGTPGGGRLRQDSNLDGVADGLELGRAFADVTLEAPGAGTGLQVRVRAAVNLQDEEVAFDNVRVLGTAVGTNRVIYVSPSALASFGDVAIGESSRVLSYTVTAFNLASGVLVTAPSPFAVSTNGTAFSSSVSLAPSGGTVSRTVYARFTPAAVGESVAQLVHSSPGASNALVSVQGRGVVGVPVALPAPATNKTGFTAAWLPSTGATGYLLEVSTCAVFQVVSGGPLDDFTDGDASGGPSWTGDASAFEVRSDATVPLGSAATDGAFLATKGDPLAPKALWVASTETSEWEFSLASALFAPSAVNCMGVVLMSDTPPAGDVTTNVWQGYYLRVGATGSPDPLELWRSAGATKTRLGEFAAGDFSTNALAAGLNLRITRSTNGVFRAFYSTGFRYESEPAASAGALTNSLTSTSSYFGFFSRFSSPDRRAYLDNVALGNAERRPCHVPGYSNRLVSTTSAVVSNLAPETTYYYRVCAVSALATSAPSATIAVVTKPALYAPVALRPAATNHEGFVAHWATVAEATGYRLDVATSTGFTPSIGGTNLSEGFDAGASAPAGWTFTGVGVYTTAFNYGRSPPALRYDGTGDRIVTPEVAAPTNVSFWVKGQGTDAASALSVEGLQGTNWVLQASLSALPTTGATLSVPVATNVQRLRFTYSKSVGNLAFDDLLVRRAPVVGSTLLDYQNRPVAGGGTTDLPVTGLAPLTVYYYRVRATNATAVSRDSNVITIRTRGRPEPSNYASGFAAPSFTHRTVWLSWSDGAGPNLADGYLVRGSAAGFAAIVTPADGVPVPDSLLARSVAAGAQTATLTGLSGSTTYYLKLFPYSNGGTDVDYKTDGLPPSLAVTTAAAPFEDMESAVKDVYDAGDVILGSGDWRFDDALLGGSADDRKADFASARLRDSGSIEMLFSRPNGIRSVTLLHANYGADLDGRLRVYASTNAGASWFACGSEAVCGPALASAAFDVLKPGALRIRVQRSGGSAGGRICVDNIALSTYRPPTGGDGAVQTAEGIARPFAVTDFAYADADGDAFGGIAIASVQTAGELTYDGAAVAAGLECPEVTKLRFEPPARGYGAPFATFAFRVRDSAGALSDAAYTMAVEVAPRDRGTKMTVR